MIVSVKSRSGSCQKELAAKHRTTIFVEDADALYAEYAAQGVEFARGLGNMPWHCREFVVKDCDGRLLAFGANL
jgi:hypothetical protein